MSDLSSKFLCNLFLPLLTYLYGLDEFIIIFNRDIERLVHHIILLIVRDAHLLRILLIVIEFRKGSIFFLHFTLNEDYSIAIAQNLIARLWSTLL